MGGRIGLFGGTFDPPHRGHLAAAEAAHRSLRLDRTLLVVANDPWQKTGSDGEARHVTAAPIRLGMVRAAVGGRPGLEASDVEIARGGVSYTFDTVAEFAEREPGAEIFVIVGADAARGFDTWHRHDEIALAARLVAVTRPGHRLSDDGGWLTVEMPAVDVSSSDVRRRVATGEDIVGLVEPEVARMIEELGLYRSPGHGDVPRQASGPDR